MVYFVGAGPGAADLITVRGQKLLQTADVIIYAGSLVNPDHLQQAKNSCKIFNSASMTLEEVIREMKAAEAEGKIDVYKRQSFASRRIQCFSGGIYGNLCYNADSAGCH